MHETTKKYWGLTLGRTQQFLISIMLVCVIAVLCYIFLPQSVYRVVALILLVTVSFVAMFFDMLPVLSAALLSALIWNFFFIPPQFTFTIGSAEDALMFAMYFIIATLNAVLTHKIRRREKDILGEEEKERTLKLYNTVLNSLSHELRTPLSTIIGATDNLQNHKKKLSAASTNTLIAEISSAALRINQQVENLLNMSRLESGFITPKKDWVDITELMYEVVGRIEHDHITQHIQIDIPPDIPFFKLDKAMIAQALYNIIVNATIYTPDKSTITVTAVCTHDTLEITIADNGKGFPENEIGKVFDKFYRLKHSRAGGVGLGLSVAKGFVEAHSGNIALENNPTGGARFTLHIPALTAYLSNLKNE